MRSFFINSLRLTRIMLRITTNSHPQNSIRHPLPPKLPKPFLLLSSLSPLLSSFLPCPGQIYNIIEMLSISALWPTSESLCIYSIFYTYICVMSLLLPSRRVDGHPHPKRGPRLIYRTNGFLLTCTTILLVLVFGGVIPYFHQFTLWRMAILVQ